MQSHREKKNRKIALIVQPQVNSSISPAADRSKGQETTAENKAPRYSPGQVRLLGTEQVLLCFLEGTLERGFRPSSLHHLSSSGVSRSGEGKKGGRGRRAPEGRLFEDRTVKRLSVMEARTR